MEPIEDTHLSSLPGSLAEAETVSAPQRKRRSSARWFTMLAALEVLCLVGGVFAYTRLSPARSAMNHTGWCASTGAVQNLHSGEDFSRIAAISPENVWVLGDAVSGTQVAPLLNHWDGTSWSRVSTADTSSLLGNIQAKLNGNGLPVGGVFLQSLLAVSADDIWAIGSVSETLVHKGENGGFESNGGSSSTLIEHWDGHHWQIVANPDGVPQGSNSLNSAVAISTNDIWAVGDTSSSTQLVSALVEHWNGSHWSIVQLPASLQAGSLSAVTATSANDVWAIGTMSTTNAPPLALHWDGHMWGATSLPPAFNAGLLPVVKAISVNDVWAIGTAPPSSHNPSDPHLVHWGGQQWSLVEINKLPARSTFTGITASGPNDVWVVGNTLIPVRGRAYDAPQPLIEYWNGQHWSQVALPNMPYGSLEDVAIVGGKVWVVGTSFNAANSSSSPLLEMMC